MKQIYYKMKRIFLFLFWMLSAAFLISCTNDEQPELYDQNEDFVPEQIIIGVHSDVSIDQVFDLINEQGLFIDYMSGFFSYSTLPNDSINYIINYLKDKPFLNKNGFTGASVNISETDDRIAVSATLFEMDIIAQSDWLETIRILQLKELGNNTPILIIKVNSGTEKFWIEEFKGYPEVKWAELNGIIKIAHTAR